MPVSNFTEPLPTAMRLRTRDLVLDMGDAAAALAIGVSPLAACRAALGLALQPKVRRAIICHFETADAKAVAA